MIYFVRVNGDTLHNNPNKPDFYVPNEPPRYPTTRFNYVGFCLERGIIRIGWPDTGDLTKPSKTGALARGYSLSTRKAYIQEYLLTFRDIPLKSIVLVPDKDSPGTLYIGEVSKTYHYFHSIPNEPYENAHRLGVDWDKDSKNQFIAYQVEELGLSIYGGFWRKAFYSLSASELLPDKVARVRANRKAQIAR